MRRLRLESIPRVYVCASARLDMGKDQLEDAEIGCLRVESISM